MTIDEQPADWLPLVPLRPVYGGEVLHMGNHVFDEASASVERLLARMADIRISESEHGPADARRYDYAPTYILRGLQRLHLEFAPAG